MGFEQVEAVRYAHFLCTGGVMVVNQQAIAPITVSAGSSIYPSMDYLRTQLSRVTDQVHWVPALDIARTMGNDKVANVVMLGALSALLEVPERVWLKIIIRSQMLPEASMHNLLEECEELSRIISPSINRPRTARADSQCKAMAVVE